MPEIVGVNGGADPGFLEMWFINYMDIKMWDLSLC